MSTTMTMLAAGPGWHANDVVCTAGPRDRPFEERHDGVCIAVVTAGTFQYRTREGTAVMAPGALLLGNPGACFQCGHEHAVGDRCLSFHLDPASVETIAADIPGARLPFDRACLPPAASLVGLLAAAVTARDDGDVGAIEEVALRLTGAVLASLGGSPRPAPVSRRDERAVTAAVRYIEAGSDEPLTLTTLAAKAAMSRYHFLRVFRRTVGLTPHQYLLRIRLHCAALALRSGEAPVASIALDAGFNDLSTFHRRFRRLMGVSPARYRSRPSH